MRLRAAVLDVVDAPLEIQTGRAHPRLGHTFLQWNYGRGMLLALLIGAAGGVLGGKAVAPMFLTGPIVAGAFSPVALVFAIMAAIAALTIANMSLNRWES